MDEIKLKFKLKTKFFKTYILTFGNVKCRQNDYFKRIH